MGPASTWRRELSQELRRAAGARYAAVVTCPPGDWSRLRHDCDPHGLSGIVDHIQRVFVPRIEAAGEDWRFALRAHGPVYAPLETARATGVAAALRKQVLAPVGIDGYVTAFFVSAGLLVGIAVLGAEDDSQRLLARSREPLEHLARAAGETLGGALALAEACGAQVPVKASCGDRLAGLTAREREVALLSARGFANLNVAAHLGISEGTVAVHLKHLYARLGVHGRAELAQAVAVAGIR
jgi:DNA-binding CsgD family transcriptional regulator